MTKYIHNRLWKSGNRACGWGLLACANRYAVILFFVEKNSKGATPWNVKKATYSYNSPEMATKRPIGSPPTNEITLPPTAKRRGNAAMFDMVRPTNEQKTAAHFTTHTGGKINTIGLYQHRIPCRGHCRAAGHMNDVNSYQGTHNAPWPQHVMLSVPM